MAKPIAVTSATPQTIAFGSLPQSVQLDGSSSFDPDGYAITAYEWVLVSAPSGSAAALSDATIYNPTFTADEEGGYLFFLKVTSSDPSDNASETVLRSAPNSALVEVVATTENYAWSIPAPGARNWADRVNEIFLDVDSDLGTAVGVSHDLQRTNASSTRYSFTDARTAGAPFSVYDYLVKFSNKNASGVTGTDQRGAIQLDMEQADAAGESCYAFEMTDGDGLAALLNGPWRGLFMKNPSPTGTEVPTMIQAGVSGAEVVDLQLLRAFWDESGTNVVTLWRLEDSNAHRSILECTEQADVDNGSNITRYYKLYPDHNTPASIEDIRLQLERTRLHLRRNLFIETKSTPDDDFNDDWDIEIWMDGRAAANQPRLGWDETNDVWWMKETGTSQDDAIAKGTNKNEVPRMERHRVFVPYAGITGMQTSGLVPYHRSYAGTPTVVVSGSSSTSVGVHPGQFWAKPDVTNPRDYFEVAFQPENDASLTSGTDVFWVDVLIIGSS